MLYKTALIAFLALTIPQAMAAEETKIIPTAQLQVWGTVFDQDEDEQADPAGYGDPENDPGLSIRRGRIGLFGQHGPVDFFVEIGVGAPYDDLIDPEPDVRIANAYVRASKTLGPGTGRLSAGVLKVPFSRESIMSSRNLTFQERSIHSVWIAPIQDVGVLADWESTFGLRAQAGVFNGGGDLFGDDNGGLLYGGRVEYARGDTYRTWGESQNVTIGIGSSAFYNQDVATNTLAFEADVLVRIWRVTLLGEFAQSNISPGDTTIAMPDTLVKTTQRGVTGQIGYWQPFKRGGLEIATRLSLFDDATHLDDNGDVALIHSGLTWRDALAGIDLGAGYIHREELQGRSLANDSIRLWVQLAWPKREAHDN